MRILVSRVPNQDPHIPAPSRNRLRVKKVRRIQVGATRDVYDMPYGRMVAGGSVAWKGWTEGRWVSETLQVNCFGVRVGGWGTWGVTLRTLDQTKDPVPIGEAAGRRQLMVVDSG